MKLVLLPGLDGTGVLFRPLLAALPSSLEPIVVSYPTDEARGYEELIPRVVASLPQNEPFVLLGESFGGPLSLSIAATHPKALRGLILCGSFVSCPFEFVPNWAAHLVRSFPFRAFPLYAKFRATLGMYANHEHFALSLEALSQVSAHVFAHRVREIIRVNVTAELKACAVPILYIQGERDLIVPSSNLSRILLIKPTVKCFRIRAAHMMLKTQPLASAKAISGFVDEYCL